jgi:hypothetical protein
MTRLSTLAAFAFALAPACRQPPANGSSIAIDEDGTRRR